MRSLERFFRRGWVFFRNVGGVPNVTTLHVCRGLWGGRAGGRKEFSTSSVESEDSRTGIPTGGSFGRCFFSVDIIELSFCSFLGETAMTSIWCVYYTYTYMCVLHTCICTVCIQEQ